jgi:hypothetical protein
MRKLKIMEHISLDGVIQSGEDDFPYADSLLCGGNAATLVRAR